MEPTTANRLVAIAEELGAIARSLQGQTGVTVCPLLAEMAFSTRVRKALRRGGIATVQELTRKASHDLLTIRNFGLGSLTEVRARLAAYGLRLADEKAANRVPEAP